MTMLLYIHVFIMQVVAVHNCVCMCVCVCVCAYVWHIYIVIAPLVYNTVIFFSIIHLKQQNLHVFNSRSQ